MELGGNQLKSKLQQALSGPLEQIKQQVGGSVAQGASAILSGLGLMGGITQNTRLIRLHTNLGPDVLLAERAEIVEQISPRPAPATYRPTGLTATANTTATPGQRPTTPAAPLISGYQLQVQALSVDAHLELSELIGQVAHLELLTAGGFDLLSAAIGAATNAASGTAGDNNPFAYLLQGPVRSFHGHITQAALVGSDGGLARYQLTIEPWLSLAGYGQDSRTFHHLSVPAIIDQVLDSYASTLNTAGTLTPQWRWELADPQAYPQRSLCTQYQESDLDFVHRLMLEEGLFYWFEHTSDSHTLVIADHNGIFAPNPQPRVRYSQSGSASFQEDTLIRFSRRHSVQSASVQYASIDHRTLQARPVQQQGLGLGANGSANPALYAPLSVDDIPGAYSYEDSTQGQRLALNHIQALDALRLTAQASGPWRTAAPATTFILADHPIHQGLNPLADSYLILSAHHRVRNNLSADVAAQLHSLLPHLRNNQQRGANHTDEPLFLTQLQLQPAAVALKLLPYRQAANGAILPDARLLPKPHIHGSQTAIVVGNADPIHTDRDHRIKIQFHWQRGGRSSSQLASRTHDNAPANDQSGTWVRVSERIAGPNWGSHFLPRVGQEVLVTFLNGDIDRPIVIGNLYNGQGSDNAQGNQMGSGPQGASGNAPAWFPGDQASGNLQGHQHGQTLAGFKTQELTTSAQGFGGYNQLVLDDTPGQGRIELSTTAAQTRLQLGHLLQQNDNLRLNARGDGIDLSTAAWGAVRAGSGLLISAHGKAGSTSTTPQMEASAPRQRLMATTEVVHILAKSARNHHAGLPQDNSGDYLPVQEGQAFLNASLEATTSKEQQDPQQTTPVSIQGGEGTIPAWVRPEVVIAAPKGIGAYTPKHTVLSAGTNIAWMAQGDINTLAQGNRSLISKTGISLFTYGKTDSKSLHKETGMKLHAASGNVVSQSLGANTLVAANSDVNVSSTNGSIKITAPDHVLLTAGGAAIHISGSGITIKGPGSVKFKSGSRVLGGPASMSQSVSLKKPGEVKVCEARAASAAAMGGALVTKG